jgi:small conductance mechanosensitive channel
MADTLIFGVTLENLLLFVLVMLLTIVGGRLLYNLVRNTINKRVSRRGSKILAKMLQYSIYVIGLYLGIVIFLGVSNLTALGASLGLAALGIGFASQQIIQNMMAGVMLTFDRRILLDDWIDIVGTVDFNIARVKDITLTRTVLLDPSGKLIFVPNSMIMSSMVINYTRSGFGEVSIPIKVQFTEDLERVKRVILEVAKADGCVLPNDNCVRKARLETLLINSKVGRMLERGPSLEEFQPRVLITNVSGLEISLSIRLWITEMQNRDEIVSNFIRQLINRFNAEKILLSEVK